MQGWKRFLEKKAWKQLKKSDWAVLALVGILLLVIAIPAGKEGTEEKDALWGRGTASEGDVSSGGVISSKDAAEKMGTGQSGALDGERAGMGSGGTASADETYVEYLEEKLEHVLSQMEGVGKVEVMITISDAGEYVVEKDRNTTTTVTQENDSAGGSRTVTEGDTEEQTIYVDTGEETYPYIQKEKLPTVEGVVVVAEGGGSSVVISNISETVKALLPVEAHRIKVVKMCSKEE